MNTEKIPSIFQFLNKQEVKPVHSVPFCLRLYGKKVSEIAEDCNVTRDFFYKVLVGERKPNPKIIAALETLGINPWIE